MRAQGAALTVEDLLDLSEFSKLVTQRPEGQAIAHQARPLLLGVLGFYPKTRPVCQSGMGVYGVLRVRYVYASGLRDQCLTCGLACYHLLLGSVSDIPYEQYCLFKPA